MIKQIMGELQPIHVYDRMEITCQRMGMDVPSKLRKRLAQWSVTTKDDGVQRQQKLSQRLITLKKEIHRLTQHYQEVKAIAEQIEQSESDLRQLYQQAQILA